jgi:hypothetical protein
MDSTSAQSTLDSVLAHIRDELRARSGRFLDRAERALAQQWTEVHDLNERDVMQQATRWLTSNKPAIHARLYRQLIEALNTRPASPADQATLRVLETGELTITLARDQMVSKVMNDGRSELAALETRFELLARAGAYANPKALWPGAMADNFVTVLKSLGVPDKVQRMLLDTYGDEGIRLLLEFYRGINALLVRNNVGRNLSDPFATSDRGFDSLLAGDRSVFALARGVRLVLGRLQQSMADVNLKAWTPGTLRELIERQFAQSAAARATLSRAQAQSIDHVESLLLDWLRDDRISSRVREEIRRLTLPILVARLICGDEFAAADNPIRVFLRQLAVLGYRDQEFPLSTYDSLRLIVDRIVSEQGGESASFRSAADALNTLSRQEVRRRLAAQSQERSAKPVAETTQDSLAAREAHRQVTAELTEHAAGLALPEEIKKFVLHLLGPWMMVRHQRYGQDSAPWRQAREFAASFFEGLRPAVSRVDAERKHAHRERILHQARVRAERSNTTPERVKDLLAALERHLAELDRVDASAEGLEPPRARALDNFLDGLQPIAAA